MFRYARRDLLRNPRRTLAALVGVVLGVGLFSSVLFFIDGSGASMTKRAVAPVTLDMQRVITAPYGERLVLKESLAQPGPIRAGAEALVRLTVMNKSAAPVNEVVIRDTTPDGFAYVPGSATRSRRPLPDVHGESPFGHGFASLGYNAGTIPPTATVTLTYRARARQAVPSTAAIRFRGSVSSRENLVPLPANQPGLVAQDALRKRIAAVPGVAAADELAFASLPPGSLRAGAVRIDRPIRVFGFTAAYAAHHPAIRLATGSFDRHAAVLSPEAADALGVGPGGTVSISLPGGVPPIKLQVSGIADLSRSRPLFNSRKGLKLEDFLYVSDTVVIDPALFRARVVPAFRSASATRGDALNVKSPPTLEIDVLVDHSRLNADPGTALAQTNAIDRAIVAVAPRQDYLLDNISNTLHVARGDAAVAKRMFVFLGLPGLLLAGLLAAYAGSILARTQRREHANLRLRGATRSHLTRILVYRTIILAGVGSLLGTLLGLITVAGALGRQALFEAAPHQLAVSALLAMASGTVATALALYLPGRRALTRAVSDERRELALDPTPNWRRFRLDYVGVALAGAGIGVALRRGAFDTPGGSVSTGEQTSLPSYLLLLPLSAWFAGALVSVRAFEAGAKRLPIPSPPRFGPIVRGILGRSLSRRTQTLAMGIAGVGLVVAFGVAIAVFAASYDAAKAADAEYTVGSNIRVTPSPLSRRSHPASFARDVTVPGIASVTPVVSGVENAYLRSDFNSDQKNLAAIDPVSFATTAALSDSFFPGSTAAKAMAELRADPTAILLDESTANDLKLEIGDHAEVLLAARTKSQKLRTMTVAGTFTRFPGFPERIHIIVNLGYYQSQTGLRNADFFLARTRTSSHAALARATAALSAGPAKRDALNIDSTETTFNKDQTSLTALNIRGLVDLNSLYTLLISSTVIGIFVFGLMLQRRREFVTLRAQGLSSARLHALIFGEAAFIGLSGLATGVLVGGGMGLLLVRVLPPLFILPPTGTVPFQRVVLIAGLLTAATVASTLLAVGILRRLNPSEVLREQ